MRSLTRLITVVVAVAAIGTAASAASATSVRRAATVDAHCQIAGYIDFAPGITTVDQAQTLTFSQARVDQDSSEAGTCPLAEGALTGTLPTPSLYCTSEAPYELVTGAPATGRLKIAWADGSTSIIRTRWTVLNKISPHSNRIVERFDFAGKVVKGPYAGDRISALTSHIVTGGGCFFNEGPTTQTSFFAYNRTDGKVLTFSH